MKNTIYRIGLLAGIIAATSLSATAQGERQRKGPRPGGEGRPELTEEQKAERKKAMEERRAKWEALSDEEKAKLRADMEKRRAEWEALSPEEREAKMKERRAAMEKLVKKYDKDGDGLNEEERKALSEDPEFKKMGFGMRGRRGGPGGRPGGRQGGPGGKPEGRKGGKGGGDKPAPKE